MITVSEISFVKAYKLRVKLSNGVEGIFDVSPYLDKGIFTQLQNVEYFKQVRINFCGICWPKGQDFSADTIAYEMKDMVYSHQKNRIQVIAQYTISLTNGKRLI